MSVDERIAQEGKYSAEQTVCQLKCPSLDDEKVSAFRFEEELDSPVVRYGNQSDSKGLAGAILASHT